ncbi:MAG: alpha/beta fold hydrolase [Gammaproteobacteria bacterium]|nr:alpha/beta fold hydrolase [Gammaproteobacteria bacterium]
MRNFIQRIHHLHLAKTIITTVLLVTLHGCAMVKVSTMKPNDYIALQRGDVLTTGKLSLATQDTLNVANLDAEQCRSKITICIATLQKTAGINDERRLSSLSETWMLSAMTLTQQGNSADSEQIIEAWLEVARYAYAYLFFTTRSPDERAFEDRQTQVKDYYNYAVQQAVALLFQRQQAASKNNDVESNLKTSDSTHLGQWTIDLDLSAFPQDENRKTPQEIIPAASLRFNGLRSVYRRDGFGAELVAVYPQSTLADNTLILKKLLKQPLKSVAYSEMSSPEITVLFKFNGDKLEDILRTHQLQLAVYDPYMQSKIDIRGQQIPLAANFTAGYGLWLARSGFATQSLRTVLGLSEGISAPHVYLMQPYDPQRRIIVMLHGLASSPEAWVNVTNEVLGDAALRQHYQVWQVYYPTNAPLAYNLSTIRDALTQTLKHFDPTGTAPASNHMILIGHSMGGVLSRLLVSTSQDQIWNALFANTKLTDDRLDKVRTRLDPILRFNPMPNVSRVIFIAAPHRGTPIANNTIGRWIGNTIKLPISLLTRFEDVTKILTEGNINLSSGKDRLIPNSIDNLKDTDPFIRVAATLPISPKVTYHSIIAKRKASTPLLDSDDGVVPYRSAHLDGASSEKIIISSHSVQGTPESILEIRRILHEDLGDSDSASFNKSTQTTEQPPQMTVTK